MSAWLTALVAASATGVGLMAGLYWAFSTAVMPALAATVDDDAIQVMRRINRLILNPLFVTVFTGTSLLGGTVAVTATWTWDEPGAGYRLAAGLLAVVGNLVITAAYNVPRNNALDAAADTSDGPAVWASYLRQWVPWNHVRALACTASLILLLQALAA